MPRIRIFIFVLFSFLLVSTQAQITATAPSIKSGISQDRLERLSDFLESEVANKRIPGAVALISRKGRVAYYESVGFNNLETQTPMQKDQIFYIQSMTKPIVSVALMMLYEEGHFYLNDPIATYLPQFKEMTVFDGIGNSATGEVNIKTVPAEKPITIAQILSHTGGFLHGLSNAELDQKYVRTLYQAPHETIEDRVNALAKLPLVDQPGNAWHYSASPDIAALLIEHFSGMSTAEFLQKRVFEPLGMKDSGYNLRPDNQSRAVTLHNFTKEGNLVTSEKQTPAMGHTIFGGTHGLFSTAEDYMKFSTMVLNEGSYRGKRLLSRKTVELMTANHVGDLFWAGGTGFGLGFSVRTDVADGKTLGSEGTVGWSGLYNTYFFIDPEEELIGILMMQFLPYSGPRYKPMLEQLIYQAIDD